MAENTEMDLEEVRRMARLSRLNISPDEEELFARQFASILDYMAVLQSVDTATVEPLYNPAMQPGFQRPDLPDNKRSAKEILANAPETDGEMFIVPKIV